MYIYYKMIACWVSNQNPPLLEAYLTWRHWILNDSWIPLQFFTKESLMPWPESCESPLSWRSLVADCLCRSRLKLHDSWIPKWGLKSKLLTFKTNHVTFLRNHPRFCRELRGPVSNLEVSSVAVILCDYQAEPKLQHQCWYYFWCLKSWTTLICYCYEYLYDLEGSPTMSTASRHFVHQP